MSTLHAVASIVSLLTFVGLVGHPLFMFAMFRALDSIVVRRVGDRVALTGTDGVAYGVALLGAAGGSVVFWGLGRIFDAPTLWIAGGSVTLFFLATGCRVRLTVGSDCAELVRHVLWFVPWRRARLGTVAAWVDGWGDMSDPEALHIGEAGWDEDGYRLELAWGSAASGDLAKRRIDELNRAVRELRGRV